MHEIESDEMIDKSQWIEWSDDDPMVKLERARKGDIVFDVDCKDCGGIGKADNQFCKPCKGRGRVRDQRPIEEAISDIRYAQVQIRNLLNFFWNREIISDEQHDAVHMFEAWRNQHRVAMGQQRATSAGNNEATATKLRAYGYILIIKRTSQYDQKAITNCIEVTANEFTTDMAMRDKEKYRAAIERLRLAIEPIREQIDYLEGLSENELEQLSEERMKIFIAEITKHG